MRQVAGSAPNAKVGGISKSEARKMSLSWASGTNWASGWEKYRFQVTTPELTKRTESDRRKPLLCQICPGAHPKPTWAESYCFGAGFACDELASAFTASFAVSFAAAEGAALVATGTALFLDAADVFPSSNSFSLRFSSASASVT